MNPSRGPERLVRAGQWLIALLLAYFLIQVGGALSADLPLLSGPPPLECYLDQPRIVALEADLEPLRQRRQAVEAYARERASFDTWRSTRSAIEQSDQNPEVIARARQLDVLLPPQQLSDDQERLTVQLRGVQASMTPLLVLALGQYRRFPGSDQWPFVWGFLLFGLVAFFGELVPYLPSFGTCIRYGLGAVLTFLVGRALIRWLYACLARQQQEQAAPQEPAVPQEQRQRSIRYGKALETLGCNPVSEL